MARKIFTDESLQTFVDEIRAYTDEAVSSKVDKVSGKGLSTNDYTTNEKNKLAGITAGAQPNQNAFSNIKVGTTTVAADTTIDTLELVGSNITITPDATNDKVTFSILDASTSTKGVVQLTNSTSSTSTTTAATPSSVKSAYDLANQAKTAAATAQSTADSKQDAITGGATTITSSNLTASRALVSNSSGKVAVSDITSTELGYLDGVTSNVQTQIDNIKTPRTVRFTVGTSASGWTTKNCDYLCDGTSDQAEINAAITALPSTGGEVVLLDGTYNIAGEIKLNKANVILRGNGASTKIQVPTSYNTNYLVINVTGDYCTVRDLYINPTNISSTAICISLGSNVDNCIIENNSCVGATTGIALNSGKYNRISNNFIQAVRRVNTYGIDLRSGSNNDTIIGNTCIGNGKGIAISGSTSVAISEHTITDNICNDGTDGLSLNFANNCTIIGNTCNNNYDTGIYFRGNNNTISGNTCYNNVSGIQTGSTSNSNTITGNTARESTLTNMRLSGTNYSIISNNNIAVLLTDADTSVDTLELYSTGNNHNIFIGNHLGIKNYISGGGTGNSFVNNYYNGASTTSSNTRTIDENGNAWFAGNIYVGGASQDDGTVVASTKSLTTAEYTALEQSESINANTFYMLTDAEDEGGYGDEVFITVEDIDAICGSNIFAASEVTY